MASTPTRRARDAAPTFVWDDQIEHLYESWHRRVAAAEHGHRLMADRLRRRHLLIGIPVVVLTTLVGTSAFASMQNTRSDSITTCGHRLGRDPVGRRLDQRARRRPVEPPDVPALRDARRGTPHRGAALRVAAPRDGRDARAAARGPRRARSRPGRRPAEDGPVREGVAGDRRATVGASSRRSSTCRRSRPIPVGAANRW